MAGKAEIIYWDTCIFLAHVKDERREDPPDMQGIAEHVEKWSRGEWRLATSVVTVTEILQSRIGDTAYNAVQKFFQRRDAFLVQMDVEIARLASEIRDYYDALHAGKTTVSTPDAIHLATAISLGCTRFFTFDEKDKPNQKSLPLIPLSPCIAGKYDLRVEKPRPTQLKLPSISGNPDEN